MSQLQSSKQFLSSPKVNAIVAHQEYSGPLPQAEQFEHYEGVLVGSANRILTMAEKQADHRRKIEKVAIYCSNARSLLGLFGGLIIALVGLVGGAFLIYKGKSLEGLGAFVAVLVSLLVAYFKGLNRQEKDLGMKSGAMLGKSSGK